jgi:cytochrome c oxidase subunit I+III
MPEPSGHEVDVDTLKAGYSPTLAFLRKWLFTTDHKEVGILYFFTSLWFVAVGGALAEMFRTQLAFPSPWAFLSASSFDQAISAHGLIMVLFFLSPLGAAFANYFVPLQIGAKDVAYPRFNAFSYWMYLMGGLVLISGFFAPGGAGAAGWTNYAPLNSTLFQPGPGETLTGLGLLMLWGSLTMGSVNLTVTILTMRAPGMTWKKMPMFTWFVLFTQILLLFSIPSVFVGTLALITDRALGTVFFLNTAGSSILWDNMWWFFGHPEVYVVVLPAFGAVFEVFQVFSGRPLYAKKALLISVGLIMIPFSFSIYAHHMFLTGINSLQREFIDINTEINSLPSGLIVISLIATMIGGAVKIRKAPFLFAMASVVVFIIGGVSGVFDSSVLLDQQLRGTYQIVGHFHYIMVGAAEFGLMAAIYYWLPKWTGRMYSAAVAKLHFVFSFAFFNLTFFPMFYLFEMPRRVYTYLASTGWGNLNFIETLGAYGFGAAQILLLYIIVQAFRGKGPPAPPNPWGASTPEWTGDARSYIENYPAVFATSMPTSALPNGHSHAPHVTTDLNSKPFVISVGLGLTFIGYVFSLPLMLLGVGLSLYGVYGWAKDDLNGVFKMPKGLADDPGETWPFKPEGAVTFGEWREKVGAWLFLATDFVFFSALIGMYIFVRLNIPNWPAVGSVFDVKFAAFGTMVLITSAVTVLVGYDHIKAGRTSAGLRWLVATLILGGVFLELGGFEWLDQFARGFNFGTGMPGSTYYLITGITGAHVLGGLTMLTYVVKKTISGKFNASNVSSIKYFSLFWLFVVLVTVVLFPLVYLT